MVAFIIPNHRLHISIQFCYLIIYIIRTYTSLLLHRKYKSSQLQCYKSKRTHNQVAILKNIYSTTFFHCLWRRMKEKQRNSYSERNFLLIKDILNSTFKLQPEAPYHRATESRSCQLMKETSCIHGEVNLPLYCYYICHENATWV